MGGQAALGVAAGDAGADEDVDPVEGAGPEAADQFGGVLFGVVEVSAERDVQGQGSGYWQAGRPDRRSCDWEIVTVPCEDAKRGLTTRPRSWAPPLQPVPAEGGRLSLLNGGRAPFASSDTDCILDGEDEDLAVADLAGAGVLDDGFDSPSRAAWC